MKLPNNYGTVFKLSGDRRKPWAAAINLPNGKRKYVGYGKTKEEAFQLLAEYHRDPIDLERRGMTFADIYKYASEEHYPTIQKNTIKGLTSAFNKMQMFHHRKFAELRLQDYQPYFDTLDSGSGTAAILLRLLNMMYKYALKYEIVGKNYASYISLDKIKEREKKENKEDLHKRYTLEEVAELWKHTDEYWVRVQLIMIYTGMRISEYYDVITKHWYDIENRNISVKKSKTKSGIREIPISDKILPFFTYDLDMKISLDRFKSNFSCNISHPSHDCRYTFVSMLSDMLIDERIINELVGHAQQGLTNSVYMNIDYSILRETINRL